MCLICHRIEESQKTEDLFIIHEFKHSFFVVGAHQYFKGYCQLLLKNHYGDLTDLPSGMQEEFLSEVMLAGKIVKDHFNAFRINYSCIGNEVEHVHYHIFPRYEEELNTVENKNPWFNAKDFEKYKLDNDQASKLASEIRSTIVSSYPDIASTK